MSSGPWKKKKEKSGQRKNTDPASRGYAVAGEHGPTRTHTDRASVGKAERSMGEEKPIPKATAKAIPIPIAKAIPILKETPVAREVEKNEVKWAVCPVCEAAGRPRVRPKCTGVQGLLRYYVCRAEGCGVTFRYFGKL